jgi:putative tricarboxylic transport membrane protein
MRRQPKRLHIIFVACLSLAAPASAQTADPTLARTASGYPNRPILIMAPANPGGGWDQTARVIQHVLTGRPIAPVPVEVFNRGGAGGTIGLADLVSRHRRNPYVVMVSGSVMVGALITHHSPFALTDTVPLARLVNEYEVVAVPAASPYRTLQQLLDAFRRNPDAVSWGGGSAGGIDHMLAGLLAREVGVPPGALRYVAFTGGGDAAAAVMGGQVTAAISGYGEWKSLADSGRVRLLAMSSAARIAPDAPPGLVESGVNVVLSNWRGLVAAPDIEPQARDWLIAALERMRGTEEWQTYLKNNSWEDSFLAGAAFEQFLAADLRTTSETLAGLQLGEGGAGYAAVGPWTFPSVLFVGLTLSLVAAIRVESRRPATDRHRLDADQSVPNRRQSVAQTAALLTGYLVAFERAGFVIATFIYLVLQARILGSRRLRRDLIVSIVISLLAFGLFDRLLQVSLPDGDWFP